ncbi:hypothetical protein [Oceanibaculum pacificum]|uniref:hypothetical protein n=1 Tax=Oceanibaculum pacificum TaxID=580166 RepID=UPI0012ECBF10|nr:hypothetical protein [Oceanibaculum pacificum]
MMMNKRRIPTTGDPPDDAALMLRLRRLYPVPDDTPPELLALARRVERLLAERSTAPSPGPQSPSRPPGKPRRTDE